MLNTMKSRLQSGKNILITLIIFSFASFAIAQSVEIKDSDDNTLITINDEGDNGGSITLPNAGKVVLNSEELININGDLYWDEAKLVTESIKTKYLTVPACNFLCPAGDCQEYGGVIENDVAVDIYGPVFLPHESTVTEFAATMLDQSPGPSYGDITIELRRHAMNNPYLGQDQLLVSITATDGTGWDTYTEGTINYATIDNSGYEYFLHLTMGTPWNLGFIQFHSARIKYTE